MALSLKAWVHIHENLTVVKQRLSEGDKNKHLPLGNQQALCEFNKGLSIINTNVISVTASSFKLKLNLKYAHMKEFNYHNLEQLSKVKLL